MVHLYWGIRVMFSENLKLLRRENGLKQEELAKKLGVNQRTVSAWENNISEPDIKTLLKLKDIFKESLDNMLE